MPDATTAAAAERSGCRLNKLAGDPHRTAMMHSLEFRLGEGIQDCVKDEKSIWDTPTIYIDLSAIASELCSGTVVFGYKVRSQLECQFGLAALQGAECGFSEQQPGRGDQCTRFVLVEALAE